MGRRLALLIATYEYADTGLRRLTTPAQDAEALAAVLEDPQIAGFEVRTLVNAPTHEVGEAIAEFYADSRRDDLTLLYFTGHGLKDDNGRLHLAMSNTKRDRLRFTALSAQLVDEAMTESLSRQKILILDCCYSGAYATQQFAKADSAVHTLETLGGRGRTVLTASDSTQYAFEGSTIHGEAAQSVFTRHLVQGLREGTADLDHDGDITVDELYNYVFDRVTAEQPNQRPKKLDQVEGRTVIAANVNWSLPSHLGDALASPLPAARLAAVEPLGRLLWANNELVRRTARHHLELLLDDDSRAVSDAAQAILSSPAPAPMPVASIPPRQPRASAAEAISIGSAVRASMRRRLTQLERLAVPTGSRLISGLNLVATAALVAGVVVGLTGDRWSGGASWYLVAATGVMVASLLIQSRVGPDDAVAFVVGLAPTGLLGGALIVGWLTDWMRPFIGGDLSGTPLVAALAVIAHLAWIAAGVFAILRLRGGRASWSVRRIAGRWAWLVIGLGVAAAAAQLVIRAYVHYESPLAFRGSSAIEFQWKWSYPIVVGILAVELAIVGPLLAAMTSPAGRRRAFLGGWVLGGFALWLGMFRRPDGFLPPLAAVVALFVAWLLLAVQVIVGLRPSEQADADEEGRTDGQLGADEEAAAGADGAGGSRPGRRLVVAIAAMLVLPAVLGGAASVVGPHAASAPVPIGLAVSLTNDHLYAADFANGKVLKISTTTREQEGDALPVGGQPTGLVLAPDGKRLYVASGLANSVTVIDVADWRIIGKPIPVAPKPVGLALNAATHRLFVLSPEAQTITVVDTTKLTTVGGPISASGSPWDLAVSPSGDRLFLADHETQSVSVLDTNTMRPARTPFKLDDKPRDLSMSSTGQLYVVGEGSYRVINTTVANPRPSSKPLPAGSNSAVLTADDSRLFVLGADSSLQKATITAIDTKNDDVVGSLTDDFGVTIRLAVSNDGQRIYLSGFSDGIVIIDAVALKPVGTIRLAR
ncbi:caspase, EACC1-associated type [Kribbella monticola]|uniref:caspase, EACC1-associated type n=1 Tax=Kribbella monticola TaxID=2185285 RepID=UPI000DD438C1|nr:caspase family protein [Kribbella monticola]